jgi:hypothetical protein
MKRLYFIIAAIFLLILLVSIFYFADNRKKQIGFQRELLSSQVEVCTSKIEKTASDFQNDVNYILYSDEITGLFNDELNNTSSIQKLQIFYYKYENLIRNIYIYDTTNRVFSVYKDNKNKFINDEYSSQQNNRLVDKDTFSVENGNYYYSIPVFSDNILSANLVVEIDIENYISFESKYYKLGENLWQWVIKDGSVILDNSSVNTEYLETGKIINDSKNDLSGFLQHKIVAQNHNYNIISSYSLINFLGEQYSIVFSLKTNYLFNSLIKNTILVVILSIFILILP